MCMCMCMSRREQQEDVPFILFGLIGMHGLNWSLKKIAFIFDLRIESLRPEFLLYPLR